MSLLCRLKKLVHKGELEEKDLDRIVIIPKGQEPCEDCISRAEAIKAIRYYNVTIEVGRAIGKSQLADIVDTINKVQEKMISELPSIQPKPMQVDLEGDGMWNGEIVYDYGKCPKCGWDFEYGDKDWEEPFCCHCGQRLKWFESEDKG